MFSACRGASALQGARVRYKTKPSHKGLGVVCLNNSMLYQRVGETLSFYHRKDFIMAVINEKVMNNDKPLSDEQINRIVIAVQTLAKNTHNAQAITLAHNLKMCKDIEEKRKWIVMFYAACFQLLSFVNMARDKDLPLDQYTKEVEKLFKQVQVNGH